MKLNKQVLVKMDKEQFELVRERANRYQLPMGAYLRAKVFDKIPFRDEL